MLAVKLMCLLQLEEVKMSSSSLPFGKIVVFNKARDQKLISVREKKLIYLFIFTLLNEEMKPQVIRAD